MENEEGMISRSVHKLLLERARKLFPIAEQISADRFGVEFSEFMRSVLRETQALAEATEEHLGIPPEQANGDGLAECLKRFQGALKKAKVNWLSLRNAASIRESPSQQMDLGDVLTRAEQRPEPCLLRYGMTLSRESEISMVKVLSFGKDVEVVVEEIFMGTMIARTDADVTDSSTIRIKQAAVVENGVPLIFTDSGTPLSADEVKAINEGQRIVGETLGRAWGLSVAQYVARRGGGRIFVEQPSAQDTRITYRIPVASSR